MGSGSLQPELKEDQRALPMDKNVLNQIKDKYCARLQVDNKHMCHGRSEIVLIMWCQITEFLNSVKSVLLIG